MNELAAADSDRGRTERGVPGRGLLLAAATALLLTGCGRHPAPATPPATSVAPAAASAATPAATSGPAQAAPAPSASAPAAAGIDSMSEAELLRAARAAYAQHRLVAPKGDNAMEYYEAVLVRDPSNQVARDALREMFPFAVPDVEKAISQNSYADAAREIEVLARADPTNYTLTLLRSKLDAQQKLQARQQHEVQQKAQKTAQALAAQERASAQQQAAAAEAERAAAQRLAEQQAASARAAAAKAAVAQTAVAAKAPVAQTAVAPKSSGITRGAELVSAAEAAYPVAAARNQTSGFVVVKFTVDSAGSVGNVQVVDSSPRRVFDTAAMQAIRRSRFKPAMKDGEPVAAVLQRRIDFKFNQ